MSSFLQAQFLKYWIPGRDVTVDEIIECFSGRSSDILTIPSKPIPTGYKIWAVAQVSSMLLIALSFY